MAAEQSQEEVAPSADPQFEPIINLPEVETKTLEEEEAEVFKMRAKLFRYASDADPPEWKERGVGDVKILKHRTSGLFRLLMRRDKTLKICANHYLTKQMELKPNIGSDRAWVWQVLADFADEVPKPELLAIRFANSENAQKFKAKFEECQNQMTASTETSENKVAEQLGQLTVSSKSPEQEKTGQATDEREKEQLKSENTDSQVVEQESRSTVEKENETEEPKSKPDASQEGTEQESRSNSDTKTETEGSSHSPDQS